jgi:hypothetical protein
MRNRIPWMLVAVLALGGCKSVTAGGTRPAYIRDAMRDYRYPKPCEELWVDGLKFLASQGYSLVGSDRELAGQEKQGVITHFLNRGHATTRDDEGVYESETDADGQGVRHLLQGKPAGKDGCFIKIFVITDDRMTAEVRRHRDYDQELLLLARINPVEGSRILEEADKAP